ncbi:MAG: glycosyltransferase [Bacteroidales bacterium]|nr:glycosyltransferase [Bacteroidales bacterium]
MSTNISKISVIVPVYNAEKTIIRCVDSLLNQTFQDMEIIIVDDHGQDSSIEVIQNRIADHSRKTMFRFAKTTVNSGPGTARNVGLQMAQGEYVAFLDSDDWVEPDMYSSLYETAKQHAADLCYCRAIWEDPKKNQQRVLSNISVKQGSFSDENKRYFLANFKSYFWFYIFRREVISNNGITFPPEKDSEDIYFLICNILYAKCIAHADKPMYHYVYDSNSLSRFKNEKRYLERLSTFRRLFDFAKTHHFYNAYKQELQFVYLKKAYLSAVINYLMNAKRPQARILRDIYREFIEICPDYAKNMLYKNHFLFRFSVIVLHRMPNFACLFLPSILRKKFDKF